MDDGYVDGMRQRGFVVRRVWMPSSGAESWTVVGLDRVPVGPVESYLAWLANVGRSPNTVRAYAHDLKLFWTFLADRELGWDAVTLEQLGGFVGWLRQPPGNVIVLSEAAWRRSPRSVNRALGAVHGFYEYHARNGVEVAERLVSRSRSGSGSYKPFLHGIAPGVQRTRMLRVREQQRLARSLTVAQVQAVLDAQRRLRDRFLFALLFGTGMRVGQALGLRHEDFVGHERRVELVPRETNANGARGKNGRGSIPVTTELVRCYSDYMHEEYGELDSDYVFLNLWGGRVGHPMSYATVDDLVRRTRARVGFHFTPHMFRHTYASMARAGGVPLEVVSKILTHRSLQTTSAIYTHTTAEELRGELERAGWLPELAG
jgi:integrase/recombinase XerD